MVFPFAVFSTNNSIRGQLYCWLWMFFQSRHHTDTGFFWSLMPKSPNGFSSVKPKLQQWWKGLIAHFPNKSVCGLNIVLSDRSVVFLCVDVSASMGSRICGLVLCLNHSEVWSVWIHAISHRVAGGIQCYYYFWLHKGSRECTDTLSNPFFYWSSINMTVWPVTILLQCQYIKYKSVNKTILTQGPFCSGTFNHMTWSLFLSCHAIVF